MDEAVEFVMCLITFLAIFQSHKLKHNLVLFKEDSFLVNVL